MQEKFLYIGEREVQVGDKAKTIEGHDVIVEQIDEMSGGLVLRPDTSDPDLRNEINDTLETLNPASKIGAEVWIRIG